MSGASWDDLIRKASQRLGSTTEAQVLAAHVLGRDRTWLIAHGSETATNADTFLALVARRVGGEPLPYITGQIEFFGLPIRVDARVLIPRPETEHVVERFLELEPSLPAGPIADIGTGSGCIAAAITANCSREVFAVDLSVDALGMARSNTDAPLMNGDLLTAFRDQSLAAAVANPPYVAEGDPMLKAGVAAHEPHAALFSGPDGLAVIQRLIAESWRVLQPGGALVIEFGFRQADAVEALLSGWKDVVLLDDLARIPRVASAIR